MTLRVSYCECDKCGKVEPRLGLNRLGFKALLVALGWRIEKRSAICPKCPPPVFAAQVVQG